MSLLAVDHAPASSTESTQDRVVRSRMDAAASGQPALSRDVASTWTQTSSGGNTSTGGSATSWMSTVC